MQVEIKGIDLNAILGQEAGKVLIKTIEDTLKEYVQKQVAKDYYTLSEACDYLNISYNTLMKWNTLGLKIIMVQGVKRIAKKDIDEFLSEYRF